jgi:hypothetical protein
MKHIIKKPTKEALKALTDYWREKKEKADWVDGFKDKDIVRLSLLNEQSYICAYCMQRIENAPLFTTIEHWEARELVKQEAAKEKDSQKKQFILQKIFDYNNLFIVCKGHLYSKAGKDGMNHCDASRSDGNRELSVKPNEANTLKDIKFVKGTGRIYASCGLNNESMEQEQNCSQFNQNKQKSICDLKIKCSHCDLTCEKGLNLNLLYLMDNRRVSLMNVQKEFEQFCKNKNFEQAEKIKKLIVKKYTYPQNDNGILKLHPYCGIIAFFYKKYL